MTDPLRWRAVQRAPLLSDLRDAICFVERHDHPDSSYCNVGRVLAHRIREALIARYMYLGEDTPPLATPHPALPVPANEASSKVWAESLADPKFVASLDEGLADVAAGRVVPYEAALPGPALDAAYTLIVSSVPSLYHSWRGSPNAMAQLLNRLLLDKAIEWVQTYQRDTGRDVDDFRECSALREGETP